MTAILISGVVGLVGTLLGTPLLIRYLHAKEYGQFIRQDGPQGHFTRALEESRSHGHREGMLRALSATGGVITSAGILLAAVFAVLGVLPLVVLAQLGTVICVGVLLDTLLVRTVLVPAIAWLMGERFWWPRKV